MRTDGTSNRCVSTKIARSDSIIESVANEGDHTGDRYLASLPAGAETSGNGPRGQCGTDRHAKPGDVRVLATAAIRIPLDAIRAEASKMIGRPVVISTGPPAEI